jgi:hypothetical protein
MRAEPAVVREEADQLRLSAEQTVCSIGLCKRLPILFILLFHFDDQAGTAGAAEMAPGKAEETYKGWLRKLPRTAISYGPKLQDQPSSQGPGENVRDADI